MCVSEHKIRATCAVALFFLICALILLACAYGLWPWFHHKVTLNSVTYDMEVGVFLACAKPVSAGQTKFNFSGSTYSNFRVFAFRDGCFVREFSKFEVIFWSMIITMGAGLGFYLIAFFVATGTYCCCPSARGFFPNFGSRLTAGLLIMLANALYIPGFLLFIIYILLADSNMKIGPMIYCVIVGIFLGILSMFCYLGTTCLCCKETSSIKGEGTRSRGGSSLKEEKRVLSGVFNTAYTFNPNEDVIYRVM